jgi:hypothetical protein
MSEQYLINENIVQQVGISSTIYVIQINIYPFSRKTLKKNVNQVLFQGGGDLIPNTRRNILLLN